MCAKKYDNESIRALKGAARVRKRPAVIFGSDGIDGCEHSMFEILSNSIDEAREGFGDTIIITRFLDNSIEETISRISSFIKITSAASIAISFPFPIATPTSLRTKAGASLIPSPTIITLLPCCLFIHI